MVAIKKVVIPVDFSSTMNKVLAYATDMANLFDAHVLFFHVVNDFQGYDMLVLSPSFASVSEKLKENAESRMDSLVKEYKNLKGGAEGRVVVGDAAEEIVDCAAKENADLIIIGSHGSKGLERILMGSTAERVVKTAPCPVLVFNPYK